KMQLPVEWLESTPFSSYLIPGIILFVMNGLLSLFTALALLLKYKIYPLLMIFQGLVLCGWIISQVSLIRMLSWLQLMYVVTGMVLFLLGLLLANAEKADRTPAAAV
ncbi:MAG TPA: hypothetical protein VE870_08835, partial [Bacteroidales bacterium]|nr:hypothetical protein [Bacteroidales bacterium]